jgi:hypothetical protein
VCGWTCNPNFVHCGSGNTGCETPSNTVDNCGGCGNECSTTNATANGCDGTQCTYTCMAGFDDCVKTGFNPDGCETTLGTITSCGGCGQVCDTVNSTPLSCSGGTCQYDVCAANRADCNSTTPPNTDGCECSTDMCCVIDSVSQCQPVHSNGVGGTYLYMCQKLGTPGTEGTYDGLNQATVAADSWSTGSPTAGTCGMGMMAANCISRTMGAECTVWCYNKSRAGRVRTSAAGSCLCPDATTSPTWN